MIDIVRLRDLFQYVAATTDAGSVSDADFELAAESVQLQIIRRYYRKYNETAEDKEVLDDLLTDATTQHEGDLPDDYLFIDSYYYSNNGQLTPIEIVTRNEFNQRSFSSIESPDAQFPIVVVESNQSIFAPSDDINNPRIVYIKQPATPSLTSGSEVDLELPEFMIEEVLGELLKYFGISIKDSDILQLANQIKQENL